MASSEDVGSSRMRIGAFLRRARATLSRWRSPPDRLRPGLGHLRVVPLRQARDEVVGMGRPRGLLDLLTRRVETAVSQVVGNRAGEQHRLLQHDRDALAERAHVILADVDAVHQHPSCRGVKEARDQADQCRLPRTRQADERDHFAGPGREGDVVQHVGAVRVLEAYAVEADIASDGRRLDRVRAVDRLRHLREHRPHPFGAGERALQLSRRVRDRRQRSVHRTEIGDDDRQVADRHLPAHHVHAADDQHQRRADNRHRGDAEREQRLLPRERDPRVHGPIAGCRISRRLVGLAREALDEPDRRKRLVQPLDELRLELLHALLAVEQRGDVVADAEIQERHDGQREQRHRDVELQENREHHDERRDGCDERKAADQQVLDRVRIDVHTVDGVARVRLDVVMQPERLQMLKEAVAQAVDHPLTGIDLHLRAVDGHGLARQLKHDAGEHECHEQHERVDHANGLQPSGEGLRNRAARRAHSR